MKNPFLSLWLSGANAWAGAARSLWTAEAGRQQAAMMNEMTKQMMRYWASGWMTPAAARSRTSGRRPASRT